TLNVNTGYIGNEPCYGDSSGYAYTSVSGGHAQYTYNWSPGGQTGANAAGLKAGTYTVTVTDSCNNTATATATITQPTSINIVADSVNVTIVLPNCNGEAKVTVSGGHAPYTYLWNP